MEMINEKCCEAVTQEICCDKPASVYNFYVGQGASIPGCPVCPCGGTDNGSNDDSGSGTYDHDQLENRNLGIQHDANAIGFADGETLQEKYDNGELTGSQGEPGDGIGKMPWCSGYFKNRSLPASSTVIITPVPEFGDLNMVSGDTFMIKEDGIYAITTGSGTGAKSTLVPFLTLNKVKFAVGSWNGANITSISVTAPFKAGDIIDYRIYTSTAQSAIVESTDQMKFYIVKLC